MDFFRLTIISLILYHYKILKSFWSKQVELNVFHVLSSHSIYMYFSQEILENETVLKSLSFELKIIVKITTPC